MDEEENGYWLFNGCTKFDRGKANVVDFTKLRMFGNYQKPIFNKIKLEA